MRNCRHPSIEGAAIETERAPFGGCNQSGRGREGAMLAFADVGRTQSDNG